MASKFQLGYDDERFETTVNRNFHCLICFNVLREPVMCQRNQHYFCRGCIMEHLRRNSRTCPTCADELSGETLCGVPRIVTDYLDELNIRCDYYDRGCRELVQLQNLEQHVSECGFTPVVCGNQGCGSTVSKRDRTYHESELCEFRKLKCHNCEEISTKMTVMNTKLLDVDTKMENIERKAANTEENLVDINRKMASMEERIENTETQIANVKTILGTMDTGMTKFEANMDAKFEAVNNEVREIKMRLTEVIASAADRPIASGGKEKQHILVAGGMRTDSVQIFNYRQRLWSSLKPMPGGKRWKASSFVYNNQVTIAGGFCSGFVDNMIQMKIQIIPDVTINWSDFAAKLPATMFAHSSVVYKDSLFVTGGVDCDQSKFSDCISVVQLQPPYTVKLLSKMPEPRTYHSTVLCDDSILIFGGTTAGGYKENLSSVVRYDIKKNKCQQLPQLPYQVSEMATVKRFENVVIIGGVDKDGKALSKVIIYNIKTGNSHMLPPMLHKRRACMAVVIQNIIVVLGGVDERENELKSVEGFSFDRYTWEELPDMKEPRSFASAVAI